MNTTKINEFIRINDSWDEASDATRLTLDTLWQSMTDEERKEVGAPRVECLICKKDYGRSLFGDSAQADECASCVTRGFLTCHYGSKYSGDAYRVVDGVLDGADPVCDECVGGWISRGKVVFFGDFLHDDGVWERMENVNSIK